MERWQVELFIDKLDVMQKSIVEAITALSTKEVKNTSTNSAIMKLLYELDCHEFYRRADIQANHPSLYRILNGLHNETAYMRRTL